MWSWPLSISSQTHSSLNHMVESPWLCHNSARQATDTSPIQISLISHKSYITDSIYKGCFVRTNSHPLNIMVEWLTLLLHLQEVPGSNLGLETSYPDWGFSWISSVPPGKCQDSTLKLGHDHFFPNLFRFIIHLSSFHLMLYSLSYWESILK
jgi:hypothetical protein